MRAANGNRVDIEAKARAAMQTGANFLIVDLKCGETVTSIERPFPPLWPSEDGGE